MLALFAGLVAAALLHGPDDGWRRLPFTAGASFALPKSAHSIENPSQKPLPGYRMVTHNYSDGLVTFGILSLTETKPQQEVPADDALADFFAGLCDSAPQLDVKRQRDLLLQGWPGLEDLTVSAGRVVLWSRIYIVGHTTYCLTSTFPPTAGHPAGAARFLTSLQLPKGTVGPQKFAGPTFASFAPDGGGYTVAMPHTPKADDSIVGTSVSHRFTAHYGNRSYSTAYIDFPASSAPTTDAQREAALETLIEHAVKGLEASPTGKLQHVMHGGVPFLGQDCATPDGIAGRVEAAIVAKRSYAMVAVFPRGHLGSPDLDAFFNSFKLLKTQLAAPTKKP